MRTNVIAAIGHVALQVRDLEAAVEHAETIMGLRVVERTDDRVDLTHGAAHHSLQYIRSDVDAVDHIGLEAAGPEALAEIGERLTDRGIPLVADAPLDECLPAGLAVEVPNGFVFEIYCGMPQDQPPFLSTGVRPRRFGHVNFGVEDPGALIDFLVEVLDFRISDRFRGGAFLRCNAEHHGIGVLKGRGILAHHAWEIESIVDLGHLGDVLDELGSNLLAGPVRHGMGNNIAAYIEGPGGMLIEYYCDMLRIWDDSTYVPGEWPEDGYKWFSRWAPQLPDPSMRALGAPPASRAGQAARATRSSD
jgi:catechol-2,3-dioxygenase